MKLVVRAIEARNLPPMDYNGLSDPYVRLQLGKSKFRTKVVKKSLNPSWSEEFCFWVEDLSDDLLVSVLDEDKYFNDDFVGQLKLPVSSVFDAPDKSLGTAWYSLQPKTNKKSKKECGEILLSIYFCQSNSSRHSKSDGDNAPHSGKQADIETGSPSRVYFSATTTGLPSPTRSDEVALTKEDKTCTQKSIAGRIAQMFNKNGDMTSISSSKGSELLDIPEITKDELFEDKAEEQSSETFEELMKKMESMDQGIEVPSNLRGGVLLDQLYAISPPELNSFLFSPDSRFSKSLADLQGTTENQPGVWKFENGEGSLKRVLTYIKAATKLIKAVKATEEQTYLKADGKVFAVLASVSTPDVMYGNTFKTELLFCIKPGPELPSGEQSSQLVLSWRTNFLQSTMMKSMIEGGARQGLKESFDQFANLLAENIKPVDIKDIASSKEQVLASMQVEIQSDWKLAVQYFANFTVLSTICIGFYLLVHIWLAAPSMIQGLEFAGLDLPDSVGEVIVCAVLVLQGKRLLDLIARFMQARVQKGSDHGIKALGDGWLLTVALIEGYNLAAVDSSGFSDPYVVFTCNGRTRTSSIKFQKSDPQWNEIFEFDAMDEPPSVLDVGVYNFDGPFDESASLGYVEINFVKTNISDLADVWLPLHGKLAQACQSKLHLRIFLDNTRGGSSVKEYLTKMEKEVGKKINLRSPQTNSAFQKLFGLPAEEFLINDFTCHLKRKMLLQDIEDIQVAAPTLASMGSPVIVMTLRRGKGMDARHGARTQDREGRLKFYFQSFVSFNVVHRTILALWKARALSPEQKVQIAEEESDPKILQIEESGSFLGIEDVSMSEAYSSALSVPTNVFMELFGGGELDRKVMSKTGCIDYSRSPWELDKADVYQRQIYYKFDKRVSHYSAEITSTQQRSHFRDKNSWLVEEVLTLHGVPLGDYFNLHLRYQVEDLPSRSKGCNVQVYFGVAWLKSTRHQKRIAKKILLNLQDRLKVMFDAVEEFGAGK